MYCKYYYDIISVRYIDNQIEYDIMKVDVISYLVTKGDKEYKKIQTQLHDEQEVAPAFSLDTDKRVSEKNSNRIRDILGEELKESNVMRNLSDVKYDDIMRDNPYSLPRTKKVKIGEAHILDDGVIANIDMKTIEKLKP